MRHRNNDTSDTCNKLIKGLSKIVRFRPLTNKVSMKEIALVSNVSGSTAYNYGSADDIVRVKRDEILNEISLIYKRFNKFGNKMLLEQVLNFIKHEKDYFSMSIAEMTDQPFSDVLEIIQDSFIPKSLPDEAKETHYYFLLQTFILVIRHWRSEQYDKDTLEKHIDELISGNAMLHHLVRVFHYLN